MTPYPLYQRFPNDIDRSLNEDVDDKIRKYRGDYNNNPPITISCMTVIPSTSGRIHGEFVYLLFLQDHRETDRFLEASGVQFTYSTSDQFHYHGATFSSHLKSKIANLSNIAKSNIARIFSVRM